MATLTTVFFTSLDRMLASTITPGWGAAVGWSAVVVVIVIALAFLVGRIAKRYRDIDVFWSLGFVTVAVTGFYLSGRCSGTSAAQRTILLVIVCLWGLRLAGHLAWRSRGEGEDPRYSALVENAAHPLLRSLLVIYLLQAVMMFLVSITITIGMYAHGPLLILEILGVALWLGGFVFETVGDYQLAAFVRDPSSKGQVLDRGLWSWTRHPNYFGDALVWWGIFLVSASSLWGALSVFSPVIMMILLTRVSGKPLLERRMASTRLGYDEYCARTSPFLPRPPKR